MKKEVINYDDMRAGVRKAKAKSSPSMKKSLVKGFLLGPTFTSIPYFPQQDILIRMLGKALAELFKKYFSNPADFSEDDRENIEHLIREGRRQGLEELEINISKDLGAKIDLSAGFPVKGIPLGVKISVDKKSNGDYVIRVKYLPINHMQDIEALKKYADLHEKGVLTDEEFERKKRDILGI